LSVERQRKLEEALLFSGQFKDALKALMDWLAQMEKAVDDKSPVHGDLDTVIGLVEQHKNFEEELNSRTEQVEQLKQTAEELLKTAEQDDAVKIKAQVTELTNRWENVWDLSKNKTKRLEDALRQAEELHKNVNMLLEWLSDAEMKLRFAGPLPEDEEEVDRQIAEHMKFMMELKEKEKDKDFTIDLAEEILKKCHPDAVQVIKHWITIIQSRWDEVASWALQRQERLEDHKRQLQELLALLDELMQWLIGKEQTLVQLEQEPLPDDLEIIRELIVEHQGFMDGLTERQPEIDNVCKPMRPKSTAPSSRRTSKAKGPGRESREDSADFDPSRRQSRVSPGERATPDRRAGPRFGDRKGSRASVSQGEGGIKNPRAKALWDKWRHVWMMAWERDRRLKDKLNYLQELEKVKNFDWEAWRKKYLKHHNNKKSRVQDFFRKLDDDGDGYCPRDEFIDGILRDKFASSKLEMNAVADKFDHGDGMIDWREFMAALRPDWEDRGPLTDTQRIDDEIKRQVAQCTCRQKFKVWNGSQGPITKIKEKSERSLGMNVRASVDYGYDSYDRRTSTQGRNSLTPGSRPGSRPPSRHGSNMSLNSEDDGGRNGGVRRTSSMRSGSRTLRPSPMGFGSGVPRKTSTPGGRERTDSTSSTDRTPFSARTRQPSNSSIPVPTNNRTRTPSGSGPRGSLQRSGSNLKSTPYSADGNKFGSSSALRNAVSGTRDWQQ